MAWISSNAALSQSEQENNVTELWNYLGARCVTRDAVAALAGNMQTESYINPGVWESFSPYQGGYGLVQWTPYTKYSDWVTQTYGSGVTWQGNGYLESARLLYEANHNLQWFANSSAPTISLPINPPITFLEWLHNNTLTLSDLTKYFLCYYEHPASLTATVNTRITQAAAWRNHIATLPDPPSITSNKMPIWMYLRRRI